MRVILGMSVMGMAVLAVFYLRQRRMSFREYIGWGLLALCVPLFGPFWVIYSHPGKPAWPPRQGLLGKRKTFLGRRPRLRLNFSKKWVTGR